MSLVTAVVGLLLGTKGIATRSKKLQGAPGLTNSIKKLLGTGVSPTPRQKRSTVTMAFLAQQSFVGTSSCPFLFLLFTFFPSLRLSLDLKTFFSL